MIINFKKAIADYNIIPKGVIHVGGYNGDEIYEYTALGIKEMIFFEPQKDLYKQILDKKGNNEQIKTYNFGLGSITTSLKMYRSFGNDGASSSFLEPDKHLTLHPGIAFKETEEEFDIFRMDDIIIDKISYNFLNMDVQGYELEVLKGGVETLKYIDIIVCEVNRDNVYKNNVHINDLDKFLEEYKFKRVEVNWLGNLWGDACYVKC